MLFEKFAGNSNIITIDSRNHGRSLASGELEISYKVCAEDCIDTLNFLGVKNAHFIGEFSLFIIS